MHEMKLQDKSTYTLLTSDAAGLEEVIRAQDYGSARRLFTVTAYVQKFVQALKQAVGSKSVENNPDGDDLTIDARMLSVAEATWIRESQRVLVNDKLFPMWRRQFGLYQDGDGIWRCGGRLGHANIPPETKHPALLPRNHYLTELMVRRAHERVIHNGVKETLTELRSRFWIIKGRSLVRKLIHGHHRD